MAFCTITHRVDTYVIDGPDSDRDPDKTAVNGRVIFTPMLGKGDSVIVTDDDGPRTVTLVPIEARITSGELYHRGEKGIKLFAGGDNANPSQVRYKASFYNMVAGTHSVTLRDVIFDAEPGGAINLADVQPVAGTTGQGIIQGEPGNTPYIQNGNWWVGDADTGVQAIGHDGEPGEVTQAALDSRIPETLALRRDTSVGTRIMAGNTMIFGDTGWRDVTNDSSSAIEVVSGGHILVRRIGSRVMWKFSGVRATNSYGPALTGLATGWRPSARQVSMTMGTDQSAGAKWEITTYQIAYSSATSGRMLATTNEEVIVEIVTDQAWPRSQPGSPV